MACRSDWSACVSLYLVYMRQPAHMDDQRHEPFWEFGSFGRTGCHRKNLLSKRSPLVAGDQLAFLQGGHSEVRIIGVTPGILAPTRFSAEGALLEVNWGPAYRPLPYTQAPLLINNRGATEFPAVIPLIRDAARSTWCGKAASKFRSRATALTDELTQEILAWFANPRLPRAERYPDAIMAPQEQWHQIAMQSGWFEPTARRKVYLGLLVTRAIAPVDAEGPLPEFSSGCPRRCC